MCKYTYIYIYTIFSIYIYLYTIFSVSVHLSQTLSLFLYLGCCEWCCNEYKSMYLFEIVVLFLLDINTKVGMLYHIIVVLLISWVTSIQFSIVALLFYIPINRIQNFLFSTSSSAFVICLIDDSHSNRWSVISLCGFDLYFPDD